ncbi:glycosyltransferase, partial [Acinetobacter baumannii]
PHLICVGQRDFGYEEALILLKDSALRDKVKIFDDVSDIELPSLYRHAMLFIYPAFAEGFGMPPLEAMASGIPVITSNT